MSSQLLDAERPQNQDDVDSPQDLFCDVSKHNMDTLDILC